MGSVPLAHVPGGLSSWTPLYVLVAIFVAIVSSLETLGASGSHRSRAGRILLRIPNGLERLTKIPGWAAAMVGTTLFALVVAGQGFISDVAWHIYTGRDKNLLTAPHTGIVLGLFLIGLASLIGVLFATLQQVETTLRWRALRVPWSAAALAVLGGSAVLGFPLDDLWHLRYGIDVTMWSPTHLLMIVGASISPVVAWLALAEAGVRPSDGPWARGIHVVVAVISLQAFAAVLGEFHFGVPQFQELYDPVILLGGGAFALLAAIVVLGRGWALGAGLINVVMGLTSHTARGVVGPGFVHPRTVGLFLGSAVAIELAALVFGLERRLRLAVASSFGVATLGLAVEYAWNRGAIQPWRAGMLPSAAVVGWVAALGMGVLGVALGAAVLRQPVGWPRPARILGVAGVLVIISLLIPLPRRVGHVQVALHVAPTPLGDRGVVTVTLTPASAADHATWFQVLSWQGGGLVVSGLHRASPGTWVSDEAVPISGSWKTMLRLSRGNQLMAVPIALPADPTIPAPAVTPVDRVASFENERHILMREQNGSMDLFALGIGLLVLAAAGAWITSFVVVARRLPPATPPATPSAMSRSRAGLAEAAGPA